MMPKAYLLDLYETCAFADWDVLRDPMAKMLGVARPDLDRAFSATRPARNVGTYANLNDDCAAVLEALGLGPDPAAAASMAERTLAFAAEGMNLYGDTLPVVAELRASGAKVVLVSNCCWETPPFVDRLRLRERFDEVLMSVERGMRKPDRGVYALALSLAGDVPATDALFVDDQVAFCDGARAVGLPTRHIVRPGARTVPGMPAGTGHHPTIRSLSELLSERPPILEGN